MAKKRDLLDFLLRERQGRQKDRGRERRHGK